jgi:biotin carboxylase
LRALKALGCRLIVLDGVPTAPGFQAADVGVLASTFDEEATVEAARVYAERHRIDGVIGTARRVTAATALAAEALGLPGPAVAAARVVADRLAMKAHLRAHGVRVPWSAHACGPAALRQIAGATRAPLVVKPVDGWAARGVVRLLPGVDLAWAHRVAVLSSPSGHAMVEVFTAGRQLSVVALVGDGTLAVIDVAERCPDVHERFAPFVLDAGHERPVALTPEQGDGIDALLRSVVGALGLRCAVVTAEIVLAADGPVLVDLALGLVDGHRLAHEIPLATGIDVIPAALALALGATPAGAALLPRWGRAVAERAVFSAPGTVVAVRDAELAAQEDGVTLVDLLVDPGGRVLPPTSNLCQSGVVVATGESREQAVARAVAAASRICIVTTDGRPHHPLDH